MKEENPKPKENRPKKTKYSDQNEPPKNINASNDSTSKSKSASSWGSHIVKGLARERKIKLPETATNKLLASKNKPITNYNYNYNYSKVKKSSNNNKLTASSQDLFVEIENLRALLKESKQREFQLQAEHSHLWTEFEAKKKEVEIFTSTIKLLESHNLSLKHQLLSSNSNFNNAIVVGVGEGEDEGKTNKFEKPKNVEMEVVQLRRLNKELQLHKRTLSTKVASLQSQLSSLANLSQCELMGKIEAEASSLRRTNEDLSKQVEGLQMSRLNEVEELAYLRWVNSHLRNELQSQSPCSCATCDVGSSPHSNKLLECCSANRLSVVKKLNRWPVTNEDLSSLDCSINSMLGHLEETSSGRRHSISGSQSCDEDVMSKRRRQSDGFVFSQEVERKEDSDDPLDYQKQQGHRVLSPTEIEKRALRIPNPPPRPSSANSNEPKQAFECDGQIPVASPAPPPPPPPPPPPQRFSAGTNVGDVQRAPQVVEFYHSLMKRGTRRDSSGGAMSDSPNLSSVRSNMIGEIENRSSYLLAIKADVETQAEFVNSLIKEVNNAVYQDIDDVVAFVKWLDDELCFLVDERAVLKHFDWPEKRADTLREAAFSYKDLKKLELEVAYYHDDPRFPCDISLRKMVSLSEKIELTIYNILRTRECLMRSCKEFQIPTAWLLDGGIISKVKLGSVKLAKKYMNRVARELQSQSILKDVAMDYMLLQGVRFAFRIHQFVGGFDAETMQAFEELRKLANALDER